jgi:hypothetical protein
MDLLALFAISSYAEPVVCLAALALIISRGQLRRFRFVAAYLGVRGFASAMLLSIIYLSNHQLLEMHIGYRIYFYAYWVAYVAEAILSFCILYQIVRLVLEPLSGLQRLGSGILRVLGPIIIVAAVYLSVGPHMSVTHFIMLSVTHLSTYNSLFALAMLLLVAVAIRPMGLSFRSRAFGVSLGLGILAITEITLSFMMGNRQIITLMNIINTAMLLLAIAIWIIYFARREPLRRDVQFPPASRLSRWNRHWLARRQGHAI